MLAFVLGGGGSRGALQVGALEVLLEAGIQPEMVIGTSVGALNAAFFASDPTPAGLERLRAVWLQMNEKEIYPGNNGAAIFNVLRGKPSLFDNGNMRALVEHHLPFKRFSELSLPCYAVATDLDTGELIAFGDREADRIVDGLMSSTALVPAHPAWQVGKRRFIDGGFGATLPVREAIARGATQIIALNLTTPPPPRERIQSALEIMLHTNTLMMRQKTRVDLAYAAERVDLTVIELESDGLIPISDFSQTADRLEMGRVLAEAALAQQVVAQQTKDRWSLKNWVMPITSTAIRT